MKKPKCKFCGKDTHYSTFCWSNPKIQSRRKKIKPITNKQYQKEREFRREWIKDNPPDEYGYWNCYLQIADLCPVRLSYSQLALEHVKPKSKGRRFKWDKKNVLPACVYCNGLKGSETIARLIKKYEGLEERLIAMGLADIIE